MTLGEIQGKVDACHVLGGCSQCGVFRGSLSYDQSLGKCSEYAVVVAWACAYIDMCHLSLSMAVSTLSCAVLLKQSFNISMQMKANVRQQAIVEQRPM